MTAQNTATSASRAGVAGLVIRGPRVEGAERILTPDALSFLVDLHRAFEPRRAALLAERVARQQQIDAGVLPGFLEATAEIRESAWTVAEVPDDLLDRRVEITGPVERKMVINALNSGARVFMADFEDSNAPTWSNALEGQINMFDAVRRTITYTNAVGKHYALNERIATLLVRPRGWHLPEKHVLVDDEPMAGALVDFGLFFYHNAREQVARGTGPYFYLPKLQNHLEARLWNDVFVFAQDRVGLPRGTVRATVLIEHILAAFEMDEILWELRDHSAGLNCGRWDYIFSVIRTFREHPEYVMPDRGRVTMDRHFLSSYVALLIRTCHRRGIHAMGGMAAQIPIKNDEEANAAALEKVRLDKLREVTAGHDGTWVAHPGLVEIARSVFDAHMPGPNQIARELADVTVTAADLLAVPEDPITERGLRHNVDVGLQYLEAWLGGLGCVPIYHLMEDAATAEISRSQVWQWVRHGATMDDGRAITADLVREVIREELDGLRDRLGTARFDNGHFGAAAALFVDMMTRAEYTEWLTLAAYDQID